MTNAQIIEKLSTQLISRIEGLTKCGIEFQSAYDNAKQASCAGSAVWAIVNKHFNI